MLVWVRRVYLSEFKIWYVADEGITFSIIIEVLCIKHGRVGGELVNVVHKYHVHVCVHFFP